MIYKLLIGLGFLILPSYALAANTHHFVCADFDTLINGASCASDIITISGATAAAQSNSTYAYTSGTTYYISSTYAGTGHYGFAQDSGYTESPVSASWTAHSVTMTTSDSALNWSNLFFSGTFSGTLSSICITDTSGDCEASPPTPATDASSTSPCASLGTTTDCFVVFNPNQDVANGVFFFFIGFWGVIWLFAKKK
jgi:hypothetical protein